MIIGAWLCGSTLPAHAEKNPLRNAYFGETHLHTSWSFDAFVFGTMHAGPEEAYQYALGKPIKHPAGYTVQLKRPLDFQAVTDHSEYMGTVRLANDPQSDLSKLPDRREASGQEQRGHPEGLPLPRHFHHHRAGQGADQP